MDTGRWSEQIRTGKMDIQLLDIYIDKNRLEYQKERYIHALNMYEQYYGSGDVKIFSAPGRSEIGGNHTDHQHGEVLAAAINLDAIAIVKQTWAEEIRIISEQSEEILISFHDLYLKDEEKETSTALVSMQKMSILENHVVLWIKWHVPMVVWYILIFEIQKSQ